MTSFGEEGVYFQVSSTSKSLVGVPALRNAASTTAKPPTMRKRNSSQLGLGIVFLVTTGAAVVPHAPGIIDDYSAYHAHWRNEALE